MQKNIRPYDDWWRMFDSFDWKKNEFPEKNDFFHFLNFFRIVSYFSFSKGPSKPNSYFSWHFLSYQVRSSLHYSSGPVACTIKIYNCNLW